MGNILYNLWKKTAHRNSNRAAIRLYPQGEGYTFSDIASAVEKSLSSIDVAKFRNRMTIIQMTNSPDWLIAFLACQAAGAIAVPVDPDIPEEGILQLMSFLKPHAFWNANGIELFPNSRTLKPACLIKLTSGSTGAPRPLIFEDQEISADGHSIITTMGIGTQDVNLAAIPFGHSYGLGNLIMPLIIQGTPVAVSADPFPFSLAGTIRKSKATVFPSVPTLLNGLVRSEVPAKSLSSIRLFISAGSPLAATQARAFHEKFGKKIHNFYGSSETGGIAFDHTGEDTLTGRAVGVPMDKVQTTVSPTGRLLVSGPAVVSRGNRRRMGKDAAFLLPDLATRLPDGSVALLGRNSRLIKLAGKRLNLAEVENRILEIDGVMHAYVTIFHDRNNRTQLIGVVVASVQSFKIKESLKSSLPAWKIPSRWISLDRFPVTARGKVDFRTLEKTMQQRINDPA